MKIAIPDGTKFGHALQQGRAISKNHNKPVRLVFNCVSCIVHKNSNLKKVFNGYKSDSSCKLPRAKLRDPLISYFEV